EHGAAWHHGDLPAQSRDDLIRARMALIARLEPEKHEAVVERLAATDEGGPARDRRVLADDFHEATLQGHHLIEGHVLRRIGDPGEHPGVLLREEALGDYDVEQHGGGHRGEE